MTSWHEFHQYNLENGGMDDMPGEISRSYEGPADPCSKCGGSGGGPDPVHRCRHCDGLGWEPDDDGGDVCHCGLPVEDHKLGGAAEHNFVPKWPPVFTHCNDCGRKLHTPDEEAIGLCEVCGNL